MLGVNFWGVLYGLQVFVPHMLGHGEEGHIVNTASLAGLMPGGGAYSVSKHAVLTLTEGIYQQFRAMDANLSASVLCPGFVNTNIGHADRNRPEEYGGESERTAEQEQAIAMMLGGGMDPDQVADIVFDSIVEQRCYILPHPAWDDVVLGRVEHVLAREAPISVDMEEMLRRRAAGQEV
ncbi:MAG: SDR family NAD(P)-dependent oxidoreductase [Chloroflexi bacterium]|nr:SDR family NAD(P)-dependent oxidoreductase [Chloroflexota bacterium]